MSTLREAAEKALEYMESRECHHESTHRGGVLWTICDDCGRKWADDEGGFVEYREPIPITDLRAALSAAPAPQPAGGERERYEFVLAQCREAQDIAASRGWALNDIATASTTDPRARKIATEALLSALSQPAAQQDPVAWMWQHPETGMTGFVEHASPDDLAQWERMNRPRKIVTPLYTQAEERKPLTDEQINDFVRRVTGIAGGRSLIGEQVTAFTRIVESAHGITATKGDSHA